MGYMPPPELQRAIDEALQQTHNELLRLYENGYVGSVTIHCGPRQLRVKVSPERTYDPITLDAYIIPPT